MTKILNRTDKDLGHSISTSLACLSPLSHADSLPPATSALGGSAAA